MALCIKMYAWFFQKTFLLKLRKSISNSELGFYGKKEVQSIFNKILNLVNTANYRHFGLNQIQG